MDADKARIWIIKSSLLITTTIFMFCIVAPSLGYPLTYDQVPRLAEIVVPVFLGYLGSATHFLFHTPKRKNPFQEGINSQMINLLICGPIIIFGLAGGAALFAFGYTNRVNAEPGTGMNIDQLAVALSGALGLLAVTTNVSVSYLFAVGAKDHDQTKSD